MRIRPGIFIVAALLSAPAWAAPGDALTPQEVESLGQCGISAKDAAVFGSLPDSGQAKVKAAIAKRNCSDTDLVRFKNTRNFVGLYMTDPPPSKRPVFDRRKSPINSLFMTLHESKTITRLEELFLNQEYGG